MNCVKNDGQFTPCCPMHAMLRAGSMMGFGGIVMSGWRSAINGILDIDEKFSGSVMSSAFCCGV
jgi:hypothetical protein